MIHKHENDIDMEMEENVGDDGRPVFVCVYCGEILNEHGITIYKPRIKVPEYGM